VGEVSSATASAVRAAGSKSSSARIAAKSMPVVPGPGATGPVLPPVLGTAAPAGPPAAPRAVPEPPRVQRSRSRRRTLPRGPAKSQP
jgi:hypothetical protein